MASVTQCDVCNNVVKHEQSKYIEVFNVTKDDARGPKVLAIEVCPDCYAELCTVLKRRRKSDADTEYSQAVT